MVKDMETKQIENIALTNGLTLEILDHSRKIAADRWAIKLTARIQIEVSDRWFSPEKSLPIPLDQLQDKLGKKIEHTYNEQRTFVDNNEKQAVFNQMVERLKSKLPYYGHPDFAARCILKTYADRSRCPA